MNKNNLYSLAIAVSIITLSTQQSFSTNNEEELRNKPIFHKEKWNLPIFFLKIHEGKIESDLPTPLEYKRTDFFENKEFYEKNNKIYFKEFNTNSEK